MSTNPLQENTTSEKRISNESDMKFISSEPRPTRGPSGFLSTWKGKLAAVFILIVVLIAVAGIALRLYSPRLRETVRKQLEDRFASSVEISDFHLSVVPSINVELGGLVFRHHGRTDVPPLIEVKKVRAGGGWMPLIFARHLSLVELEGLHIRVPPRGEKKNKDKDSSKGSEKKSSPVVVSKLVADGAILEMLPKKAGKDPLRFEVYNLEMNDVATDRPMQFDTKLKNATPPGLIVSQGKFGPWEKDEPGDTPVEGDYTLSDANLGVFKGIGGKLTSTGKYKGVLAELNVDGQTDTPDFVVDVGNNPVHLKTTFHATVDGTSGETLLRPVHATFGNSEVIANGGVVDVEGVKGKAVKLDVVVSKGRLEDMMRFGVKGDPPMAGDIRYHVKLELPPGPENVVDKLKLDGRFGVDDAKMTKTGLAQKIEDLSDRAKGKPQDAKTGDVESEFNGKFKLSGGTISLADLAFKIPGADLLLNGTYGLRSEKLDFRGTVHLDAKVSQTMTGWKSALLKVVDPFFKNKKTGVGSEIPIRIAGTREQPAFKLDVGKAVSPKK